MTKKKLALTLAIALSFMYIVPTIASTSSNGMLTLNPEVTISNEPLFTQDSIYLPTLDGQLLRWSQEQQGFEFYSEYVTIPEDFPRPIDVDSMDEAGREEFSHVVMRMFTDGEELCGLNQFMGTWARLKDGELEWQATKLDSYPLRSDVFGWVSTLFAHSGFLYGLVVQEENELMARDTHNLVMVDLATGESQVLDTRPIICATPYREGELMLLIQGLEDAKPGIEIWNQASQSLTALPSSFPAASSYNGLAYDKKADTIYVATPGALLCSAQSEAFEICAGLPFDFLVGGTPGHILTGGYYALHVSDIALVPIGGDSGVSAGSLRLRGNASISKGLNAYREAHPGFIVQWDDRSIMPGEAGAAIQSGNQETDIYLMPLSPELYVMLQKGYAADLSAPTTLKAEFEGLYPQVKAALSDAQGLPRAYPIDINAYHPSVDTPLWREYLGEEPLPKTYIDFLEAMQRFTAKHDNVLQPDAYFVADLDAEGLLRWVIAAYIQRYETTDEPLSFDRPALREALECLDEIARQQKSSGFSPQQILGTNIADEDIKPELFFLISSGLTKGFELNDEGGTQLYPFTFTGDEEPQFEGYLNVLLINPLSPNMEEALTFAQMFADRSYDPLTYAMLHPAANDPVPNPDAEQLIAADEENLRLYTEALECAKETGDSQAEIAELEFAQSMMHEIVNDKESRRWLLTEKQLADYRAVAGQIRFYERSRLLSDAAMEQIGRICSRYAQGQLSLDLFLSELDSTARLIHMEQQ